MTSLVVVWYSRAPLCGRLSRQGSPRRPPVGEAIPRRANVLIYLVDTLRSDRLGILGYPRPITPNIDRFAESSSLFLNAIGQSSWTKASVGSIFTGLWPPAHGAIGWKHKLSSEIETLAERLQADGYRTAAFVTNPNVVRTFGFTQGFDEYTRKLKRPSDEVNQMVFDWFEGRKDDDPFLLYVHTMDPHAPYAPREPFKSKFAPTADEIPQWQPRWRWPMEALPYLSDLYDAEIAFNDASFGQLLGFLEERGLYDDTLIVFVSDHGEEFKEHGRWRHGANLHAETLNFPLIVKFPDQQVGTRVETAVQHIDLLPTILASVGLEIPEALEGRDLAPIAMADLAACRDGLVGDLLSLAPGKWSAEPQPREGTVEADSQTARRGLGDIAVRLAAGSCRNPGPGE